MNNKECKIIGGIIILFPFLVLGYFVVAPLFPDDIECDIDTCLYHNKTLYYNWCDNQYGINKWYLLSVKEFDKQHGAIFGMGGMYLAETPIDDFYDYKMCFKK